MSALISDDLASAAKWLDDAESLTRNATVLLERVSDSLADEAQAAVSLISDTRERTRKALASLEHA
ncbi:MAG: hypothetical protein ACRDO4_12900 [Nocardioides sp.]